MEHSQTPDDNEAKAAEEYLAAEATIERGIAEAKEKGTEVDPETARTIAAYLTSTSPAETPALQEFAENGVVNRPLMRTEYMSIYSAQDCPISVREWIIWLGTFLAADELSRDEPVEDSEHLTIIQQTPEGGFSVKISTADSPDTVDAAIAKSRELINYFGTAFRAYLTLAGVYATDPKLEENFHEFYVASYPDMTRVIDELTEVLEWESDLQAFAAERGIEELVSLDRVQVERIARNTWDIVKMGGQFHVFIK